MKNKNDFSLSELSKIEGAKPSPEVLEFFNVLDKYISDDDLKKFLIGHHNDEIGSIAVLRDDDIVANESTRNNIIANFPEQDNDAIIVPIIVQ